MRSPDNNAGFGLIEVVVSMFLFLLISLAFLPLLINSLRVTADNTTRATATQLVQQWLEEARQQPQNCVAIQSFITGAPATPVVDQRGIKLYPKISGPASCPTDYPNTVKLAVEVHRGTPAGPLVSNAVTQVLVVTAN